MAQAVSEAGSLHELIGSRARDFPTSGEINLHVPDKAAALKKIGAYAEENGGNIDLTDGVSIEFSDWRANVRPSNTEDLLRLDVETRGNPDLLRETAAKLRRLLESS